MAGYASCGADGGVAECVGGGWRGAGVGSSNDGGEGGGGWAVVVAGGAGYTVV